MSVSGKVKSARLTPKQKEFIDDIKAQLAKPGVIYVECFPWEERTAESLRKRGLIEMRGGVGRYFEVRLTEQ